MPTVPPPIQTFPPTLLNAISSPMHSPPSPPAALPSPPPPRLSHDNANAMSTGDESPLGNAGGIVLAAAGVGGDERYDEQGGRSKSSAIQTLHEAFQSLTTQHKQTGESLPRRSSLPPPQKRPLSSYSLAGSLLIKQRNNQFITTTPTNSSPNNSGDDEEPMVSGCASFTATISEPSSRAQSPQINSDSCQSSPRLPSPPKTAVVLAGRPLTPQLIVNSPTSSLQIKRGIQLNRAKTLGSRPNVRIAGVETRVEMGKAPPVVTSKRSSIFRRLGGGGGGGGETLIINAGNSGGTGAYSDDDHYLNPSFGIRQGKKLFTVYKINVKTTNQTYTVYRRYSEFEHMDKTLQKLFPYLHKHLPEFPPKRLLGDNMDPQFLEQRAKALHIYIQQIFSSPVLMRSQPVREFLCKSDALNNKESPLVGKPLIAIEQDESSDLNDDESSVASTRSEPSNSYLRGGTTTGAVKPSAVFNTLPDTLNVDIQQHHQQQQQKKAAASSSSSLKKSSTLRRTLKRVGWVKSEGHSDGDGEQSSDIKQSLTASGGKSSQNTRSKSIFSTMLYSFALGHKVQQSSSSSSPHPPPQSKPPTPPPSPSYQQRTTGGRSSGQSSLENTTEFFDYYADAPTTVNIDDFYLLKLIGKGNFGKVILAKHKSNQQVYAIKVISKSSVKKKTFAKNGKHISHPHDIDHVMAERNVLIRSVRHPFLIGLRWAFQTRDRLYFVTDYVNGGELFFHLQRDRRFSELRARFYAAEIVSALEYLHCSVDVVYRDLKPENILLDSSGHIKLTDFGLAKEHFHRRNRGRTQTFCGTPEYLAPEILRKESYGFPVDWWCLGSVLYEMLVGLPPFYSKDVSIMYDKILNEKLRFPPYISIRARSVISGLLHRSPYFRLGTGPNNTSNPAVVKSHPFFEGMDWDKLYRREYQPPFVPSVQHLYDLANIDPQFVNEPIPKSILDDCSALKVAVEADEQPLLPTNIRQNNRWNIEVEVRAAAAASTSQVPQQQFRGFTFIGEDPIRGQ